MQIVELSTTYRVGLDTASPKFSRRFPGNQGTGAYKEGDKCSSLVCTMYRLRLQANTLFMELLLG